MMKPTRIAALVLLLMPVMAVSSYAWQRDVEARTEIFVDNDGSHSYAFDQVLHFEGDDSKFGFGATQTLVDEAGKTRSFYGGLIEGYKKFGSIEVSGKLKILNWDEKFRTPLSLVSSQTLGRFRFEENLEYSTIDSVKAFDAHIDFKSAGGTVDYPILDSLTITGGYWWRWSSDDNERALYLGRIVYDINETLHAQYRYRGIRNEKRVPEYYSPEIFDQHVILFGIFGSFSGKLRLKIWAGPVYQDDGFDSEFGILEDVRLIYMITDMWSLHGRIEADQVGSGYQYIYSTLSISYDF